VIGAVSKHRRVLGRGFWSLCDQGIVSAGNFFTMVLTARGESEHDYGALVILFGVLLALNNIHSSLITYQISVRGSTTDANGLRRIVGNSLIATFLLAIPFTIAIVIACFAVRRPELIGWAMLASLMWQLQETVRRGLMSQLRFSTVVWGDAISFLGQAGLIFTLKHFGELQLTYILIGMSVTSFLAMTLQVAQIGFVTVAMNEVTSLLASGWKLGRWLLLNNFLSVMNLQLVSWVTAATHGIEQAAQLQAISNILGVTHPVLMGLSSLIVPATARVRAGEGVAKAIHTALTYAGMGVILLAPIWLVIGAIPQNVLVVFYKDKYIDCTLLLRLVALVYAIDFAGWMLSAILNGLEKNRAVFFSSLAMGCVTLALTLPLTLKFGVTGAVIGSVVSVTVRVIASAFFVNRLRRASQSAGSNGELVKDDADGSDLTFSLVMCTLGRTSEVERMLESLAVQTYQKFELFIVDQNRDDCLVPVIEKFAGQMSITHIRSAPGLSRGRNLGIKRITGDVLALPDDDCVYPPDLLANVNAFFKSHPQYDGLMGSVSGSRHWSRRSGAVTRYRVWWQGVDFTEFFRRRMVDAVGLLDERLGLGSGTPFSAGECPDYVLRALAKGFSLWYEPSLEVAHPGPINRNGYAGNEIRKALGYSTGVGFVMQQHGYPGWYKGYVAARPLAAAGLSLLILNFDRAKLYLNVARGLRRGYRS
jgi:O-antigen/teichoic acid export membrane protein